MKFNAVDGDLIPDLPNDISELILLRLPFPHFTLARPVSCQWKQTLSNPNFLRSRSNLSLSKPFLFVLASNSRNRLLQWQALDLESRRWFLLPPMPDAEVCGASLACAADRGRGEIYVAGGVKDEQVKDSVATYSLANNSWRVGKGRMRVGRAFFAAAVIGGRVYVAGGSEGTTAVECYDPVADRWEDVTAMRHEIARYDAAVVGKKMLLTEGWTWPFTFTPRGSVYDSDLDSWGEMSFGMREGWTGASAVVGTTLFVLPEYAEGPVKAYDPQSDGWRKVEGKGIPPAVRKPYAVVGAGAGRIYVVGKGMDLGVGRVVEEEKGTWRVDWEVVTGPKGLADLAPCNAQLLYA